MNTNDEWSELSPDEKLNAENELLKLKLQTEFGMGEMQSNLDKQSENAWLNYIHDFEKQYAERKRCTVYEFIHRPEYKDIKYLDKDEVRMELRRIVGLMENNGVFLDTICDYEDELIYRFITEELFEVEMDEIRIPGMMNNFIYEEFHPNHDYDIRKTANDFVDFLIEKKWNEYNDILLSQKVIYNQTEKSRESFVSLIKDFQDEHPKMELIQWEINFVNFNLEAKEAFLEGFIEFTSLDSGDLFKGNVKMELNMLDDYFSLTQIIIPGFNK